MYIKLLFAISIQFFSALLITYITIFKIKKNINFEKKINLGSFLNFLNFKDYNDFFSKLVSMIIIIFFISTIASVHLYNKYYS